MPSKVSQKIKRSFGVRLPKRWIIHHLNGDHFDDRPENLVALPNEIHNLIPALEQEVWEWQLRLTKFSGRRRTSKRLALEQDVREWQQRLEHFQKALIELSGRQRKSKRPCKSTKTFRTLVQILEPLRERRPYLHSFKNFNSLLHR